MWETRALELNNQDIWHWPSACRLIEYAIEHDFNTVVVGQAELFGKLVSPQGYTPLTITTDCRANNERAVSISTGWRYAAVSRGCDVICRRKNLASRPNCY